MSDVHAAAQAGFSSEATTYARGRPEYPGELVAWLRDKLALGVGSTAVDLGAGTGKFTRLLLDTGAQVIAVEPVEAMRLQLAARMPGVRVLAGSAQAIPLPSGAFDALVCAQAFHWFATAAALAEIRRILKPGGRLGLVWNVRDESVDWVAEITRIITPYEGDAPRFHKAEWQQAFTGSGFTGLALDTLAHQHVGSADEVILDRFLSVSFIAALADERKAGVKRALQRLIATHPQLAGRDSIAFPYRTHAYWCAPGHLG